MIMMTSRSLLCLAFMAISSSYCCSAFMFQMASQKPELLHHTNAQTGTLLNIRLDVGKEGDSRMNVNGMLIELIPDPIDKKMKNDYPNMPGANGPQPQLSSGVRKLNLLQPGHFIDMTGANDLDTINGCWEMVWRDGAAAGMLICSFDLTKEYRRNDAVLPKGRFFMSFPIWTREGLDEKQEFKRMYEKMAKNHKADFNQEMEKMAGTGNLIMKAWHFRNAAAAHEKYSLIPVKEVSQIPLDHEIIPLEDKLFLSNKGLVWSKVISHQFGQHQLLGSALATVGVDIAKKMDLETNEML